VDAADNVRSGTRREKRSATQPPPCMAAATRLLQVRADYLWNSAADDSRREKLTLISVRGLVSHVLCVSLAEGVIESSKSAREMLRVESLVAFYIN
jgi:hypothetical protein